MLVTVGCRAGELVRESGDKGMGQLHPLPQLPAPHVRGKGLSA